jgi:ADP-heptose:LPS heptosyltransferase
MPEQKIRVKTVWMAAGYGDMILLSGVMKKSLEHFPDLRFDLIRTTQKTRLLAGHPAVREQDYLSGKEVLVAGYAGDSRFLAGTARAYRVLADIFGLPAGMREELYLPLEHVSIEIFKELLPWKKVNIAIVADTASPRKKLPDQKWEKLVKALSGRGYFVAQLGKGDKIKGAYSLLGQTSPKEAVKLLTCFDLVITSDSFLMHGAKCAGVPAVVLWGASSPEIFGYPEHLNIRGRRDCGCLSHQCYKLDGGPEFHSACAHPQETRCMNNISVEEILSGVDSVLAAGR